MATRLPRPLCGAPPRGFPPLWWSRGPPPRPPLWGTCGPLWRPRGPRCRPALPVFHQQYSPAGINFSSVYRPCPHGRPALPPRQRLQRGISWCRPRRTLHPHVLLPRRFLACLMALPPSSCYLPPPPPPRSSCPPLSPILPNPPRSRDSTPSSHRHSPPGHSISHGALPCRRRCLPGCGPVFCALSPLSSSFLRSLFPPRLRFST